MPPSTRPGLLVLRWRDAPTPRTKSSAKLRLIVTALAAYGVFWCARLRQPRALWRSKRRAGRSFKLLAAKEGAPGYGRRAFFNERSSYGRFVLRSGAPPGLESWCPSGAATGTTASAAPERSPSLRAQPSPRPLARSRRRPPLRLVFNKVRALSRALQAGRTGRAPTRARSLFRGVAGTRRAADRDEPLRAAWRPGSRPLAGPCLQGDRASPGAGLRNALRKERR